MKHEYQQRADVSDEGDGRVRQQHVDIQRNSRSDIRRESNQLAAHEKREGGREDEGDEFQIGVCQQRDPPAEKGFL